MNAHEMAARDRKVSKLVDALVDAGVTAAVARTLDSTEWGAVARLGKCNPPNSDLTKQAVYGRLEQIERAAARKAVAV